MKQLFQLSNIYRKLGGVMKSLIFLFTLFATVLIVNNCNFCNYCEIESEWKCTEVGCSECIIFYNGFQCDFDFEVQLCTRNDGSIITSAHERGEAHDWTIVFYRGNCIGSTDVEEGTISLRIEKKKENDEWVDINETLRLKINKKKAILSNDETFSQSSDKNFKKQHTSMLWD